MLPSNHNEEEVSKALIFQTMPGMCSCLKTFGGVLDFTPRLYKLIANVLFTAY